MLTLLCSASARTLRPPFQSLWAMRCACSDSKGGAAGGREASNGEEDVRQRGTQGSLGCSCSDQAGPNSRLRLRGLLLNE